MASIVLQRILIALAFLVGCAGSQASAADDLLPAIDTCGHSARITQVLFSRDDKYLISSGEDKVVRVWDVTAGDVSHRLRGQVAPGDMGKVCAVALSSNGTLLAVGGWTEGDEIRLYNLGNGTLEGLLYGHTDVVNGLAFAPADQ